MALLAALDEPLDGAPVLHAVLVSGWAVADDGRPPRVIVRVGAGPPQLLATGRPRPDVEAAHPQGGPHAGFAGLVVLAGADETVELDVSVGAGAGEGQRFVRTIERLDAPPTPGVSSDGTLLEWLSSPTSAADPWPRSTVGAEQLRMALGLAQAFPNVRGPARFAFLEWLYHLWKNEGDDAIPLALVAASWLPPAARSDLHLPAAWRESTWGHLVVPWLDDDATDPAPSEQPRPRAAGIAAHTLAPPSSVVARPVPPRAAWPRPRRPVGVNVVGHLAAQSGLGEATQCTRRAVLAAELPHDVLDLGPVATNKDDARAGPPGRSPYGISVIHDNVSHALVTSSILGARFLRDRYSIGYWYWEAADPPDDTAEASAQLDELWVASRFVRDALQGAAAVPVHVVPPAIDLVDTPATPRERLGLPADAACFLTMASVDSVIERKNPFGALDAFRRAFGTRRHAHATLVMKLSGIERVPGLRDELTTRIGDLPVVVLDRPMSRAELRGLIAACDVVVSLHRAEGFGLPLAEAMGAGRATIATAWSGNADFTTPETAFAVPYELVEIDHDRGPYRRGMHWAEPDLDVAAEAMRVAAGDAARRLEVAAAGRTYVRARYGADVAARVVRSHVERITALTS